LTLKSKIALKTHQLLIFCIILYFTFIGGSFYSDFNFYLRIFNQLVVTALLGGWLIGKLRRSEPWPRTALDWPILAWLAAHLIAALLGLSPRFSLEKLWMPFTHTLAFYWLVDLRRKGHTDNIARGLYMSAAVVCLVGLGEFTAWYAGLPLLPGFVQGWPAIGGLQQPFPPAMYRLNFTLNGATPLSAYLALLIPPALAIWLTARRRDDRQSIAAWLVLALIVEGLSFSRGGVIALLVSLPLTGLGWWLAGHPREDWAKVVQLVRRPATIGAAVIALVLVATTGTAWLANTFANRAGSTEFRFTLWQVALATWQEHPLTGAGPYNFGRSLLERNDPALPRVQITTAHDLYLNTAAELGLVGLAAGAWLLLAAGRAWLARWRKASDTDERVRLAAASAALIGLAVQCLADTFSATPNMVPILAVAAFVLTEAAAEADPQPNPAQLRLGWIIPRLALLALVVYTAGLAWLDVGQFYFQRSVSLAGRDNLAEASAAAEQARRLDQAMPLYTFQSAYLHGQMTDQPGAAAKAVELYQAGLAAEPVDGQQTANLAAVLWQTGNREAAIQALARAAEVEPNPGYMVNLGYFYEQVDDIEHATQAYEQALILAPRMAGSEFWQADTWRAALWPQILAQAEAKVGAPVDVAGWRLQVALAQGDWPGVSQYARIILQNAPQDCTALSALARAQFETGSIVLAKNTAQQAIDANPACGEAYLARGVAKQVWGDRTAETDWRQALFLGQPEAAYYLGQLYEAREDIATAARFYSIALSPSAVSMDVEITLYGQRAAFDLLPPLFRIGVGPRQARPWLALARLYETQNDSGAARRIYQALLLEDPYVEFARKQLDDLPREQ
jgi:tetratricopeptide (TPR) repeat protein